MKNENAIGEKIRQALKEAGLTQQKLADKLGITNPVVNVWVTGKRKPSIDSLKRIAAATNKPYSFFLDFDSYSPNYSDNVQGKKIIRTPAISEEDATLLKSAVSLTPSNTIQLPILADVPAGLPEFSDRDV